MRCDKYLPTTTFKIIHDYFEVKSVAFEDKSIDIKFSENIKIYQISVNKHGMLGDSSEPIMNTKYWTTEPYRTTFIDYVFFSLKNDISKRVTVNGSSGSSWQFNWFIYVNLKVLEGSSTFIH